jgi:hypothetical protein
LQKKVPLLNLTAAFNSENSDYATFSWKMKDCYMISGGWTCEKTMYSSRIIYTNYVIDSLDWTNLEQCYQAINCEWCYSCIYCMNSNNCSSSYFLYDCENCSDCFMCYNLIWKKYYIYNKSYSKDEYFKKIEDLKQKYFPLWLKVLDEMKKKAINKNLMIINSENCIWDNLKNCNNCNYSFHLENSQNCKYTENGWMWCSNVNDSMWVWENFDLWYELLDTWLNAIWTFFWITCYTCNNSFYNINCHNCSNIFWCIWLRNKEYCILNKQYRKEEYEKLVPKIIEHMTSPQPSPLKGERETAGEWWEFFPASISPFWYNETINTEYFPVSPYPNFQISPHPNPPSSGMTRGLLPKGEGIIRWIIKNNQFIPLPLGEARWGQGVFNWSTYEPSFPKTEKIIHASKLPENIKDIPNDILNWAIECEATKKPFKIVKQELDFYRKYGLPIPKRHPDQRHLDRVKLRNERKIYDKNCDKCWKKMKTTYSLNSKEIVYCEECYNKEVY